jgi:hypothetical protein
MVQQRTCRNKHVLCRNLSENGRGSRVRTRGLRFWRPPLYQLSYTPATALSFHNEAASSSIFGIRAVFLGDRPRLNLNSEHTLAILAERPISCQQPHAFGNGLSDKKPIKGVAVKCRYIPIGDGMPSLDSQLVIAVCQ